MKKILLLVAAIFLLSVGRTVPGLSQTRGTTTIVRSGSTLPTICYGGDTFMYFNGGAATFNINTATTPGACVWSASGSGVRSVSATGDGVLLNTSVGGSPVTGTGTLAFSGANAGAYSFLGNNTGAPAVPGYLNMDTFFGSCSGPFSAWGWNTTTHGPICNNLSGGGSPNSSTAFCIASPYGDDSNNGLSLITPKADVSACYDALPASGGDIWVWGGTGATGVPAASGACTGLYIGNQTDPNWSSFGTGAYACWHKYKSTVNVRGYGGSSSNQSVGARVKITGGSAGAPNPILWLSSAQGMQFFDLQLAGEGQQQVLIGEDSNLNCNNSSNSSWLYNFVGVSIYPLHQIFGNGPTVQICTNNFWSFMKNMYLGTNATETTSVGTLSRASGVVTVTPNVFVITSVSKSGSTATYHGTINPTNIGFITTHTVDFEGFSNAGNNGVFPITGRSTTTLVVTNASAVNETASATAAMQLPTSWSGTLSISVNGTSDSTFNGLQTATVTSPTTFTYPQASQPDGSATGGAASSDKAQAIVIGSAAGGSGTGDLFFDDIQISGGGGLRFYQASLSTIHGNRIFTEDAYNPAIETDGCSSGTINFITAADPWASNVPDVRVNDTFGPNTVGGCARSTAKLPLVVSFAHVTGPVFLGPGAEPRNITTLPSAANQIGIVGGKLFAQTDTPRRAFGPVAAPNGYLNLAKQDPTTWGTGSCAGVFAGTPVLAPDGTTNAGLIATLNKNGCLFYSSSFSVAFGDWFIFGGHAKLNSGAGFNPAYELSTSTSNAVFVGLSGSGTYPQASASPLIGGNGEWDWISRAVQYVGSPTTINLGFTAATSGGPTSATFYAPVLIHIPASDGWTKNEIAEMASHLQSYRSDLLAGQVGLLRGEQFKADSVQHTPTVFTVTPPTCSTSVNYGASYFITDASTTTYQATVTGGGSGKVKVLCNGTNWTVD